MPSTKPRSQGGGRKSNSEPRQQVFRDFGGCNFGLSPRDFSLGDTFDNEQADLQMNYVVIQNNAGITMNKTIVYLFIRRYIINSLLYCILGKTIQYSTFSCIKFINKNYGIFSQFLIYEVTFLNYRVIP